MNVCLSIATFTLALPATCGFSQADRSLDAAALAGEVRYQVELDRARRGGWVEGEGKAALVELALLMEGQLSQRFPFEVDLEAHDDGTLIAHFDDALSTESRMDAIRFLDLAGAFELRIVAYDSEGVDLTGESQRFRAWRKEHPESALSEFNALSPEAGGSPADLTWMPDRSHAGEPIALLPRSATPWAFSAFDLEELYRTQDRIGDPAIGFHFGRKRSADFYTFTESIQNRQLAFVVGGEVLSAPTIAEAIPGQGIIAGSFTELDVKTYFEALRGGGHAAFLKRVP